MKTKAFIISTAAFISVMASFPAPAQSAHPRLMSEDDLDAYVAGQKDWAAIDTSVRNGLNGLVTSGYAAWGWRGAIENYALAYQVMLRRGDTARATLYGKKALGIMKMMARHHYYGGPENAEPIGLGDGTRRAFSLTSTPMPNTPVRVFKVPVHKLSFTYAGPKADFGRFACILKISNTENGPANYAPSDYKLHYRDGSALFVLEWLTNNRPAPGASYYVSYCNSTNPPVVNASEYTLSNNTLTFNTAPTATDGIFVRYLTDTYEQTGNSLGGVNAVHPDGPGYPMRTANVGLAYGFDFLYDFPEFTPALKAEFADILNKQIDWYRSYGYEHSGSNVGNYYIRGLVNGVMYTGYGTEGANPRAQQWIDLTPTLLQPVFNSLDTQIPGGYGPQGQYTNGTSEDVLTLFSLWKGISGIDLLAPLEWTANLIPATIHGTKPDRKTFYDGGDWTNLPAQALTPVAKFFEFYLPNHPMAPYARQYLQDFGSTSVPAGPKKDYKVDFPLSYFAKHTGPVYARSSWDNTAVWTSFAVGPFTLGHEHRDRGHITINRGADYLLVNAGGYDVNSTVYHNTLLFDDRGAGDISTYPPGQGVWGYGDVKTTKVVQDPAYVYSQGVFTRSYARHHDGTRNSVKTAIRSITYIRPDILIVHDQAQTFRPDVKKIANFNFKSPLTRNGNVFSMQHGSSKLFMKSLVPANPNPTIAPLTMYGVTSTNYQSESVGQLNDSFLHVFQPTAQSAADMTPTTYLSSVDGKAQGVEVLEKNANVTWIVLYSKEEPVLSGVLAYVTSQGGSQKHVVSDLSPNRNYNVSILNNNGSPLSTLSLSSNPQGVLTFPLSPSGAVRVVLTPQGQTADSTPPATPAGLTGSLQSGAVSLSWTANGESDLAGYHVYRATDSDFVRLNSLVRSLPNFLDGGLSKSGTYRYRVIAVDTSGNESAPSTAVTLDVDATALNNAPRVEAGEDKSVASLSGLELRGTATDDGLPDPPGALTFLWRMVSGPGNATFEFPDRPVTRVSFDQTGIYVLELSANDGAAESSSEVTITVGVAGSPSNQSYMNVFNPRERTIEIPTETSDSVRVIDRGGAVLYEATPAPRNGIYIAEWNGRNERGEIVASGVYYAIVQENGRRTHRRIVVIK